MGSVDLPECETIIRRIIWYAPEIPVEFHELLELAVARLTILQLEPLDPSVEQPPHWLRRLIVHPLVVGMLLGIVGVIILRVLLTVTPAGQLLEELSERYWDSQPFLVKALIFGGMGVLFFVGSWIIGKIRYRFWRWRL